jgi:hypothetical protein
MTKTGPLILMTNTPIRRTTMDFDVRCYEHINAAGRSIAIAISDEIELKHPDGVHYMTLALDDYKIDISISNFKNLLDAHTNVYPDMQKREITSTPFDVLDFSVEGLTWNTRLSENPCPAATLAPQEEIIQLAKEILQEPGMIQQFLKKASTALVANLDKKVSDAWKHLHDLSDARTRAKLLGVHLPSLQGRKTIKRRDDSHVEFGRGLGTTSITPPEEALDEVFALGAIHFHIEMMSQDHAWFGLELINGRYFHGSISGKKLEIKMNEEAAI